MSKIQIGYAMRTLSLLNIRQFGIYYFTSPKVNVLFSIMLDITMMWVTSNFSLRLSIFQ